MLDQVILSNTTPSGCRRSSTGRQLSIFKKFTVAGLKRYITTINIYVSLLSNAYVEAGVEYVLGFPSFLTATPTDRAEDQCLDREMGYEVRQVSE
jgi:hypothetical protein